MSLLELLQMIKSRPFQPVPPEAIAALREAIMQKQMREADAISNAVPRDGLLLEYPADQRWPESSLQAPFWARKDHRAG